MPARTKTEEPGRSPQVEKYLKDKGFDFEFREGIPLEEFDQEASLRNQARMRQPLDEATVKRYVDALDNGDIFPGIIAAMPSPKLGLLIADGNHRFEAHKRAGREGIDTYLILGARPQAITMLTFEANTKHGLPTSEADRIEQALWLMENNFTAEEAARQLGVSVNKVRAANSLAAVNRRANAARLNVAKWDRLPDAVKKRLFQVSTDEGFKALAELVIDANLRHEDVSRLVNELNGLRSSTKQVEYVQAQRLVFAHDVQTSGARDSLPPGRGIRTPRQIFGMALGQIGALPDPDQIVERIQDTEKQEFITRIDDAMGRLERIRDALKA